MGRQGARVRLAIGTRLLQLLQVGVRIHRRHEGVGRLGILLRWRQLLVTDPRDDIRVHALGHAVVALGLGFQAGHLHGLDSRRSLQLVSLCLRCRCGRYCRRRRCRQLLGRLTRRGRRGQPLRLLRCVGDSIGVPVGDGGGGGGGGGDSVGVGVGATFPVAHAHLGGAHAGTAHVAAPRVDRPRIVAHARRRVLGREVAVGGLVLICERVARLGARIWLAIGTRLLQLLQVGVRVHRRHERVGRLGILLRWRQLLVTDPRDDVRVHALGHAVVALVFFGRRGMAGEAQVEVGLGLRLLGARAVARGCAPLRGRVARAVLIAPLIRRAGHDALAHRLAGLLAVLLTVRLAVLLAGIRKAILRVLRAHRLGRRRGRGGDRVRVRLLLRMRFLLLLLVALAHGRRALAPVGWPAPHVARGLPGPAVGLAPVVRDRLVDALAPVGGNSMGAAELRQRRGRGLSDLELRPVVGGLEVLGAAMRVTSLGHAHRRGALFARAGEARGGVREQSADALLAEAAAARLPLALRRALRLLVAVPDDTHSGELGVVNADQRVGRVVVRGPLDLVGPGQVVVEQRGFADAAVRATGRDHCRGAIVHPPHGALQLQPHAGRGLLRRRQALVLCGVALPSGALGLVGEGPAEGGGGRIRFRLDSLRRSRRRGRRRTSMLVGFAQVLERPRPFHPAHPAVEERPVALGGTPESALELLGNILIVRRDVGGFRLVRWLVDAKQSVDLCHELVETARVAHQVRVREHVLRPRDDLLIDAFWAGKRVPLRVGPLLHVPLEQVPSLLIGALLEEAVGPRFVGHAVLIEDQGRRHAFDRRPQHRDHAQLATLGLEGTSHVSEHVVHHVLQPGGAVVRLKDDLRFLRGEHLLRPLPARRVLPSIGVGHPFVLLCWSIVSPVQTIVAPSHLLQAVKDRRAARLRYVHIVEQPAGHGLDIHVVLLQPTPALGACAGKVTGCGRHDKRRGHPPHMACWGETAGGSKLGASSVSDLRSGRRHGRCGRKGQHGPQPTVLNRQPDLPSFFRPLERHQGNVSDCPRPVHSHCLASYNGNAKPSLGSQRRAGSFTEFQAG
eukprot:scaffold127958_cov57-Phaeocystis_antarctica.AAC.8